MQNGVNAFLDFVNTHQVKFFESEKKVYSRKHGYTGTLDAEGIIDNQLCIIDFKTSNGIYDEYRFQVAAYLEARKEETGNKYGAYWIARFGKETPDFETVRVPIKEHKDDLKAFLGALAIRRRLKALKPNNKYQK